MDENVVGNVLEIPEGLLKDLQKIDRKINSIAKHSEDMGNNFNTAMSAMTTSASNLRQQMEQIYGIVGVLKKFDINGNNVGGLNDVADEAEEAASNVTQLANAFSRINPKDMNIAELTQEIKDLNKMLTEEGGVKDKGEQIQIENRKRALEEELKWQKKSSKERIDIYRKEYETRVKELEKLVNQERNIREANTRAKNSGNRVNQDLRERELMYARMFDMIERRTARIDSMNRRYNYNRYVTSTEGSLRIAESDKTNTYAKRATAIENLETAIKNLRTTDRNYQKDLQRLTDAHQRLTAQQRIVERNFGRIQKSQSHLMDTSGQLARKLALIFSVSQIQGYIMNMVRVTGEFEKQNVALASILQNKDKADKLFNQITELAVKSPFQLKELVTYTKQLSAYQVEYDKLYDTTKRLADVSAGLGVDMQRLILAFGQVKAANFLRGTEVRQFTEAGINILGELAKYYSELEGRMISVGEVQEMVTKRMVAFGDVEEVFRRITDAGGIFYNMQEKQAETIAGQMSNLQDNIDIMLNSIGTANQTTIRNMIRQLNDLLKNWREVAWYIEKIVYALGAWKTMSLITSVGNTKLAHSLFRVKEMSEESTKSLNFLGKSLRKLYAFGRGFAIGGAVLLLSWLADMYRESTRTRRELELLENTLNGLTFGDTAQLEKEVSAFDDLIARYKLSNEGTQERRDLISSLNSNYGEYLNFLVDEKTSVEDLETAYDDVVKKMKEKTALQTLEKGYQEIDKFYTDNIERAKEQFSEGLIITVGRNELEPTQKDIENLFNITQAKVRELDEELIDSAEEKRELAVKILREYFGEEIRIFGSSSALIDLMVTKKEKEIELQEKINDSYKETMKSREANLALEKREVAFEKEKKDIYADFKGSKFEVNEKINEASKKFELDKIDIKLEFGEISEESAKRAKDRIINWGTELTKSFNEKVRESLEGLSAEDMSKILISQEDQASGISAIIKSTTEGWESQNAIIEQQIRLKNQGLVVDEDLLARSIKMEELYRKRADFLGIELNYVQKISKAELDSINAQMDEDYRLDLVDSLKSTMQLQDEYNKKYEEAVKIQESMIAQKLLGVAIDEKDLALWTERVEQYDKLRKLLGFVEKTKAGGRKPKSELEKLKQEIALIRKAGEEYKKLRKYYSSDEANTRVRSAFKDAFESYGLDINMDFDTRGVIKGIESIVNKAGKEGEQALKKATSDLKAEVDIDFKKEDVKRMQKELEDLFSDYELSMELDKSGIDHSLISDMFNVEIFSLKDVKKKLQDMKPLFYAQGEEYVKVWEDAEKKVTKMQNDEIQERMKKYLGFLRKAYGERASIIIDSQKQVKEVQDLGFDSTKEEAIVRKIKEDRDKKLSEVSWREFKESELYIKMFEDLEYSSTESVNYVLKKLEELRESLKDQDPQALKEITNQMEKLRDIQIERNPFKGMVKGIKEYIEYQKEAKKLNKKFVESSEAEDALKKELTQQELNVHAAEEKYLAIKKSKGEYSQEAVLAKLNLDRQKEMLDVILKQLVAQGKITKELAAQIRNGDKNSNETVNRFSEIAKLFSEMSNSVGEVSEGIQSIFGEFSQGGKDAVETIQGVLDGMSQIAEGGANAAQGYATGNYIQMATGIVQGIGGTFKTLGELFSIGDKKKERAIQRQLKLVEQLADSYEKLREATERAYSIDELQKGTEQMNRNLEARNQALQNAIKKEDDKKKTDHDRIKEWQKEIEANNKQIAENKKQLLEQLGGFGTDDRIKSAAEEFAQSWLDAYLEVGDGLEGLEGKMDDWLKNAVQKQLLVNLSKEFVTPLLKQFDEIFSDKSLGGANMLPEEAAAWKDLYESKSEEFNERAKAYLEALKAAGIDLSNGKGDEGDKLSGLQKGIQGITEQTAEALEAITESIRFFSADSNMQLKQIANALTNPEFESPMISELRLQTEQLRLMYSLWNSLTMTKAGVNGKCLKINIV